jgi:hypothetical protein
LRGLLVERRSRFLDFARNAKAFGKDKDVLES